MMTSGVYAKEDPENLPHNQLLAPSIVTSTTPSVAYPTPKCDPPLWLSLGRCASGGVAYTPFQVWPAAPKCDLLSPQV